MLKFSSEKLFEVFAEQYIIEFGRPKFEKIASIVNSSENINEYLNTLVFNSSYPKANDLQFLMNSHSYFNWAKEETLCLGALGVILRWSGKIYDGYDEEQEKLIREIMARLIDNSARLKYNQFNSFFHRFYRKLELIIKDD